MSTRTTMLAATMAGVTGALIASATAASAAQTVEQPFSADSGDSCPMGFTKGSLSWQLDAPGGVPLVAVRGIVADRPLATSSPIPGCADDGRITVAQFTEFSKDIRVGAHVERADNGQQGFAISLPYASGVDRIVVRVCRSAAGLPGSTCGKAKEYVAPITL
jgi:hypothetical protein